MTAKEFSDLWLKFRCRYQASQQPISGALENYFEDLQGFPIEVAREAFELVRKTYTGFPPASELEAACRRLFDRREEERRAKMRLEANAAFEADLREVGRRQASALEWIVRREGFAALKEVHSEADVEAAARRLGWAPEGRRADADHNDGGSR